MCVRVWCVCVYVRMCVCVYVCMCVRVWCVCVYVYARSRYPFPRNLILCRNPYSSLTLLTTNVS